MLGLVLLVVGAIDLALSVVIERVIGKRATTATGDATRNVRIVRQALLWSGVAFVLVGSWLLAHRPSGPNI